MGFYINPKDMSKEDWLLKNTKSRSVMPPSKNYLEHDDTVCVVATYDGNELFALGICYSMSELNRFKNGIPNVLCGWHQIPRAVVEPYLFGQKIEGVDYVDG